MKKELKREIEIFTLPNCLVSYRYKEMKFFRGAAFLLANSIKELGLQNIEKVLGRWTKEFLPYSKKNVFKRLINPSFIRRRLLKLVLRESLHNEQIQRVIGGEAPISYAGDATLKIRKKALAASLEFLMTKSIPTPNGVKQLIELTMDSRKRFSELYVMCLGMQELATDLGYKALFLTITAPARFHSNPSDGHNSWNRSYAKQSHAYINKKWEAFGKDLSSCTNKIYKSKGDIFGFRVVEPHRDGTAHWHVLLYVSPKNLDKTISLCHKHFSHSAKALKLDVIRTKKEDPKAAAPTTYMTKYLVKTVAVKQYIKDIKTDGERAPENDAMERIDAWRCATGIRAYQKFGILAGVTKWRFLRKIYKAFHEGNTLLKDNPETDLANRMNQFNFSGKFILAMRQTNTKLFKSNSTNEKRAFTDFLISIKNIESEFKAGDIYFKEKYKNKYNEECNKTVGVVLGKKILLLNNSNYAKQLDNSTKITLKESVLNKFKNVYQPKVRELNTIVQEGNTIYTNSS
ncbi:replication endonuclease [uncultured Paraglaciecola sp.]|uniref:replication endonuclease n=1 Tax=uncultured Paraglaciecola sp. TaxID=1765024 RepID=UPI00262C7A4F|nr:replication endonuclease [uncultured Paraglaciecola sp.]